MLTEDYLIRRINQAIALLMHALGLRRNGQLEAALTDVEIALELLVGMRAALLKEMDDRSVLQLLTANGRLDLERLALVAKLYGEEAEIYEAQGQAGFSFRDHLRALNFLLELGLTDLSQLSAEQMGAIRELTAWFKDRRLPVDTQAALLDYDQRLLELDDEQLAEAGLKRADLQAELQKLIDALSQY